MMLAGLGRVGFMVTAAASWPDPRLVLRLLAAPGGAIVVLIMAAHVAAELTIY
jgi:hypothetical protein